MEGAESRQDGGLQGQDNPDDRDQMPPADPYTFRDKVFRALPRYSGPYSVGMIDIEVPVEQPRVFSHITRNKRHLLQLETVLFTIFYPAALGTGHGKDPSGKDNWSRDTWLPKPRNQVAKGYGQFAGLPGWFSIAWFLTSTWFTRLPSFRNAKLATHFPPGMDSFKGEASSLDSREGECPIFPLIVFTHGLGGNRTTSSTLLGEFASYGFVVVSMEHRDGSGARTFINHPPKGHGSRDATDGVVDHSKEDLKHDYDRIDYVFPQDNPYDTSPNNEVGIDLELRKAQIVLRKAEIQEVKRILKTIYDGNGHLIAAQNLRHESAKGSSSRGAVGIDWSSWKGRFHLTKATICGHSFGAATAIEVLRDSTNFPDFSQGIALDMWAAVLPSEDAPAIRVPLLAISSEAFMWWAGNFRGARAIAESALAAGNLSWLLTIRGSIHLSQTDIPILYPRVCSTLLKARILPKRAVDLNVTLALEFLRVVMPERILAGDDRKGSGGDEDLLRLPITKEMPEEHRPDNKWIGMRLKIPHEFVSRVRNKKERGRGSMFPKPEHEIWMHVAPDESVAKGWKRAQEVQNEGGICMTLAGE